MDMAAAALGVATRRVGPPGRACLVRVAVWRVVVLRGRSVSLSKSSAAQVASWRLLTRSALRR